MLSDLPEIKENLRLTQRYCNMQMANSTQGPEAIFRSINPIYEGQELFYYVTTSGTRLVQWRKDPYDQVNKELINDLFNYQINFKITEKDKLDSKFAGSEGKILAFLVDWTLFDGATIGESHGLLDDYDCPPVDTWFHLLSDSRGPIILAWIPAPFIPYIKEAIAVNMAKCIQWLEHSHPDINTNLTA
ncbi:hypothetical protein ACTJJ0_10895 [Chitinophaga sp. 22321]|uniref:Uncharacterized protein n=1 Tax=Chitinophaga hostae TaxID=2831022 RepID=A0ABS5ISW9_9BACT|nr:hypothetical protein [Chitinophaga hostae]MBS0026051.1 hypothetical protein [Chitinophaga hostae]